jgi:hypothetical protein
VEHRTRIERDGSYRNSFTAVCSCGRIMGDWDNADDAQREAQEHREHPEPEPITPWKPGDDIMPRRS